MAAEQKPAWAILLAGMIIGGFVAFLIFLSQFAPQKLDIEQEVSNEVAKATREARGVREEKTQAPDAPGKSKLDFYDMLPELEVKIGTDPTPSAKPRPAPAPKPQPAPVTTDREQFYLQVGAFSEYKGADSRKAQLLLQNFPARVQQGDSAGKRVYRVFVGPYPEGKQLELAERELRSLGLEPHKRPL